MNTTWLQNLPIKRKLTLVILVTCAAVLLLACGALAGYELIEFRGAIVRDMSILADVLAKNTHAALAFQDDNAARETLLALQSEPYVMTAVVYTSAGAPFATYARSKAERFPPRPGFDGYRFQNGPSCFFAPSFSMENASAPFICKRIWAACIIGCAFSPASRLVLLGAILVAFALSSRLQRSISQPILALAETAKAIAEHKDYTVRAPGMAATKPACSPTPSTRCSPASKSARARCEAPTNRCAPEIAERKGAEDRVQSQLARLELLHQITRAIGERQDLQSIFQVVIRTLEDHLPVDFAASVSTNKAPRLTVARVGIATRSVAEELAMTEQARIPIDQNGLSHCVRGQLVYEPDISQVQFPFPQRLAQRRVCVPSWPRRCWWKARSSAC